MISLPQKALQIALRRTRPLQETHRLTTESTWPSDFSETFIVLTPRPSHTTFSHSGPSRVQSTFLCLLVETLDLAIRKHVRHSRLSACSGPTLASLQGVAYVAIQASIKQPWTSCSMLPSGSTIQVTSVFSIIQGLLIFLSRASHKENSTRHHTPGRNQIPAYLSGRPQA